MSTTQIINVQTRTSRNLFYAGGYKLFFKQPQKKGFISAEIVEGAKSNITLELKACPTDCILFP